MALSTVAEALAQYNANLSWQGDRSSAGLALEAVRFLIVNRAQEIGDQGTSGKYESLQKEKDALESFLGVTTPRAFGRSRRNGVAFQSGGVG